VAEKERVSDKKQCKGRETQRTNLRCSTEQNADCSHLPHRLVVEVPQSPQGEGGNFIEETDEGGEGDEKDD
jgi:hypothetical protein